MFIRTIRIKKIWAVCCIVAVILLAVFAVVYAANAKSSNAGKYTLTDEAQRQDFLKNMGWEVGEKYDTCRVVIIPQEFNETYTKYNELQKEQGFDLEKYKGKSVEIYAYTVYNYSEDDDNIVCNLMICDGVLIGGDVSCNELDGFMQGLKKTNNTKS